MDWMLPRSRDNSRAGCLDNCYLEGRTNGASLVKQQQSLTLNGGKCLLIFCSLDGVLIWSMFRDDYG